jgi:hypothetical protein
MIPAYFLLRPSNTSTLSANPNILNVGLPKAAGQFISENDPQNSAQKLLKDTLNIPSLIDSAQQRLINVNKTATTTVITPNTEPTLLSRI